MSKVVIKKLVVVKGKEVEFREFQKSRFSISSAKGSLGYWLLRSEDDPSIYYQIGFWESKEDREALHKNRGSISTGKSMNEGKRLFVKKPEAQWFDVVAEKKAEGGLRFF